ncbi:MAG: glycoside hydrolase [Armatimonadota bacterium]|nr:glycoside hydrolase [Armatimonadota bacterium]
MFKNISRLLLLAALQMTVAGIGLGALHAEPAPQVTAVHLSGGVIQPQVVTDSRGTIHMVYYKGDPASGNIFYSQHAKGAAAWSTPIRVNSQDNSAGAMGNIRGAQLAAGRDGRVHVVWNGSTAARPRGPHNPAMPADSPYDGSPMLYSRLNDAGTAFEPQRNLMQFTYGLDGGGSVAADKMGNVYVVWHAGGNGSTGEAQRRVWVARSGDDGKTFGRETQASDSAMGACGCCSLRAFTDSKGILYILYRSALNGVDRDIYLLKSPDGAKTFTAKLVHKWNINACPMSSESLVESSAGTILSAWETKGQVYYGTVDEAGNVTTPVPATSTGQGSKYPVLATNEAGQTLMAWAEGMGWGHGGSVAWQVYDKTGQPIPGAAGKQGGVPAWSLVTAYSRPDGSFTVVY